MKTLHIKRIGMLFLGLVLTHAAHAAETVETVTWNSVPIEVNLPLNKDRVIHFPADARMGIPPSIVSLMETSSTGTAIIIRALQEFPTTRVEVREVGSNNNYYLNLSASQSYTKTHAIEVLASPSNVTLSANNTPQGQPNAPIQTYAYHMLARFAHQQLYSPDRAIKQLDGLSRVPVNKEGDYRLFRTSPLAISVKGSWKTTDGLYVTAIKVTNRSSQSFLIDQRDIRGKWLNAAVIYPNLARAGVPEDTGAVALISEMPFEQAVK